MSEVNSKVSPSTNQKKRKNNDEPLDNNKKDKIPSDSKRKNLIQNKDVDITSKGKMIDEEDIVNIFYNSNNKGKGYENNSSPKFSDKNKGSKNSSIFTYTDFRVQKNNSNDNNEDSDDENKAISLKSFMKYDQKGSNPEYNRCNNNNNNNNSLFSSNPIVEMSEGSEKILIYGQANTIDYQNNINNNINKNENANNNLNVDKDIHKVNRINIDNKNINNKVNNNENNIIKNDIKMYNNNNINKDFNNNIYNENKREGTSLDEKFMVLMDGVITNNNISLNLMNEIKNFASQVKVSNSQNADLIKHVINSNENTKSIVEQNNKLIKALLNEKKEPQNSSKKNNNND